MKVRMMSDKEIISVVGRAKCAEILTLLAYVPGEDLWTVQYSQSQAMFHIEPLSRTFENNQMMMLRSFTGYQGSDYILIALAKDHDAAQNIVRQAKEIREKLVKETVKKILNE